MNLNTIELPDFVVREWYKDALLPPSSTPATANPPTPLSATPSSPAPSSTPSSPPAPSSTTPSSTATQPAPSPLKFLGSNRRHITLLVNAPGSPFLPDTQLTFVTRILEACRLTLADIAIVNCATAETNITTIKAQLQPATILLFGLDPTAIRLPINFPVFKPIDYDACKYLSAPSLNQLVPNTEESKLLKSKLWVCLKTIFDV